MHEARGEPPRQGRRFSGLGKVADAPGRAGDGAGSSAACQGHYYFFEIHKCVFKCI